MADSIQKIASTLSQATSLLDSAIRTADAAEQLLNMLGWELPPGVDDIGLTAIDIANLRQKIQAFLAARVEVEASAGNGGAQADVDVAIYAELLEAVSLVLFRLRDVASSLSATLPAAYIAQTRIDEELLPRLSSLLVMQFAASQAPLAYQLLKFLGIFELQPHDANPAIFQVEHIRHVVRYDRIKLLLSNPHDLFVDVYGWDTPAFKAHLLLSAFGHLIGTLGAQGQLRKLPRRVEERLSGVPVPAADIDPMPQLIISIVRGLGWNPLDVGVSLYGLRATAPGASDAGIGLFPYVKGSTELSFPLAESLTLEIGASLDLAGGVTLSVRPNQPIEMQAGVTSTGSPAVAASGSVDVTLRFEQPERRVELLSVAGAARLDLQSFHATLGAGLVSSTAFDLFVETGFKGLRLAIGGGEGDGFIQKILPADGITAEFDLTAGWATSRGVYFEGSAALEVQLPVHIELGPLNVEGATIGVGFKDGKIPIEASANLSVNLGPLVASVERLGVIAEFAFPEQGGNLGPLDLALKFKPPTGVGLAVDAGVVRGGGYLFIDADRGEYAGALELTFSEVIALKAIGIITTKMPDGSKGFSLLIIITAEFGTGIQLGFGFTLKAVGGILGLNRVVNIEPLKNGVRTGAIESVMFPTDVVANAPRIISDLRQFFPPQQDIFLVGPMAKLGWGTPTLVTAQLGIILEFPSVNITILGVIKVVLPDEQADVLRLQVNFIGRLEPANKLLWFYAELYDSRVLFITLEGGFGLLVNWGDNPNFVLSAGGFHPRYSPPPLPFPEPPRIAVNILNESYAKIRIEAYFAVTSNSVQFGARAELFFGVSAFRIEGHLAFDALFQFDPFFFSFGLSVSLSVKVFGVGLFSVGFSGLLEGPTPWHIEGKGKISLLFFKISVPFKHTWGDNQDTKLDPIEVFPLLETEFAALTNWEARIAANNTLHVALRELGDSAADQLVLHPVGTLRISQRKVPINFKLDKVGNKRPLDVNRIEVAAALPGSALSTSTVQDQFAIGQYRDLDGSAQLSSPGFEPLDSGIEIAVAGAQMKSSRAVRRVIRYETIIIDNNFKRHVKTFFTFFAHGYAVLNDFLFTHFLKGNAVTQCVHSQHYKKRMQPFDEVITIQPNLYSVVSTTDNRPVDPTATSFTSLAKAQEHMQQQIGAGSAKAGSLHVVPNTELNQAA